jgi:hypothetical protein
MNANRSQWTRLRRFARLTVCLAGLAALSAFVAAWVLGDSGPFDINRA